MGGEKELGWGTYLAAPFLLPNGEAHSSSSRLAAVTLWPSTTWAFFLPNNGKMAIIILYHFYICLWQERRGCLSFSSSLPLYGTRRRENLCLLVTRTKIYKMRLWMVGWEWQAGWAGAGGWGGKRPQGCVTAAHLQ